MWLFRDGIGHTGEPQAQVAELVEEDDGHDHGDKGREREARGFQPDEK